MRSDVFESADLFCGAGGTSTGLGKAARKRSIPLSLVAVNHWQTAVDTHTRNHPWARHVCADLASNDADPNKLVPSGHLDLLVASPECVHHSNARGGKPCNEQSRAGAFHVLHWLTRLDVDELLVENVKEFAGWGPLLNNDITWKGKTHKAGRPDPRSKGDQFRSWVNMLASMGYKVEWREINSADYGSATKRTRLFVRASKRGGIVWPAPTHAKTACGTLKRWRPVRDVIDWDTPGTSIFNRKKPLQPKTLARIEAGLRKFGGEPFVAILRGTAPSQEGAWSKSLDEPLGTISAGGIHAALCQPFVIPMEHGGRAALQSVEDPLPTITTAKGGAFGLCQPFVLNVAHAGGDRVSSCDEPIGAIPAGHRGEFALCQPYCPPFVTKYYGTATGAQPVSEPLDTVTAKGRFALVQLRGMDILFRMFQPGELAKAMGFEGYHFEGNKTEQVRQIGNAVCVEPAEALCGTVFDAWLK